MQIFSIVTLSALACCYVFHAIRVRTYPLCKPLDSIEIHLFIMFAFSKVEIFETWRCSDFIGDLNPRDEAFAPDNGTSSDKVGSSTGSNQNSTSGNMSLTNATSTNCCISGGRRRTLLTAHGWS
jgi:hypothetical protein